MKHPLPEVQVLKQCPAPWRKMKGDKQVRFCATCGKNVYNLSNMPAEQAYQLLEDSGERLCVRFYERPDGTVVTGSCPPPERLKYLLRGFAGTALGAVGLTLLLPATAATQGAKASSWPVEYRRAMRQASECEAEMQNTSDPEERARLADIRDMYLEEATEAGKHLHATLADGSRSSSS